LGVTRVRIVRPLQSSRIDPSCARHVTTACASSHAVDAPFRVLPAPTVSSHGLTNPPWPLPLTRLAFEVFPMGARSAKAVKLSSIPLLDFALLQSMTRAEPPASTVHTRCADRARPPLLGFCAPTAYEVAGSDQHRGCLPRLRGAFRLSQPLDASFPPKPSGLVSYR
jgi:hypothetical protein